MRLIGLATAAYRFKVSDKTLRRWISAGMPHRVIARRIWVDPVHVLAWKQYKALTNPALKAQRAAAHVEVSESDAAVIFEKWVKAGGNPD